MLRIPNIKVLVEKDSIDYLKLKIASTLKLKKEDILNLNIHKKSLDARDKSKIFYVYTLDVEVTNEDKVLTKNKNVSKTPIENYLPPLKGKEILKNRIIIVGTGPAGLFAAYLLSEYGYKPLIIERGNKIEQRVKDVEIFWQKNILNEESNVQFGEGGAGTFSDGKLNTLVKDKRFIGKKVFEIFVDCGAPKEIMYEQKPHIGTDVLRKVIVNLRNKIINMGGEFRYNTKLTDVIINNNQLVAIKVNNQEEIECHNLILAIGHSARDTIRMLYQKKIKMIPKAFALGVRVMHEQQMINKSQYGNYAKVLPPASYKLTYTTSKQRGVYSFCMCPGGYVVNASSTKEMLAINGMSNYQRESQNANSAIVVTISPQDYGNNPLDGIKFQEEIETKAYDLAKGKIPLQLLKDYQENKSSLAFKKVIPEIKGQAQLTNINNLFPAYINEAIKEAFPYFGTKIKGFDNEDTILAAVESRTSSPVRILRDENMEASCKGIFPCGEGAGYAGGITTSAMDGIKVAEQLIKTYKN